MPQPLSLAIDIGGTKTKFGFVTESGEIILKNDTPTGETTDPGEFVTRLSDTILKDYDSFRKNYSFIGAAVGAPNVNYLNGTIENAANIKWKGVVPLASLFSKSLGIPVRLTNDANAGALGEMYFGGAKGMKDFLFITLGTGLGCGMVSNGKLIVGHHGYAGELGHTIIIQHGRNCGCGRKGCLEQYCSATGIVKTYFDILMNAGKPLPSDAVAEKIDAEFVFEKALGGDDAAFYAFNYTGELLGFALSNYATFCDPEAIFLFGGLARAEELLFNPVKLSFEKNILSFYKNKIKILPSELSENDAALLGASSIVWNEFGNN